MDGLGFFLPYLIVFGLLLLLIGLAVWWLVRIVRAFRNERKRSAWIQLAVLAAITLPVLWYTEVLPFSRNVRFMREAEVLTGKSFWGWKDGSIAEASVRGEGYWLEVFTFDVQMAKYFLDADLAFFDHRPPSDRIQQRGFSGWKKTPIDSADQHIFESATPIFGGWSASNEALVERIKTWGRSSVNLYSYDGNAGNLNFYVINPRERSMAIIYSNP